MLKEHSQSHLSNAHLVDAEEVRRAYKILTLPGQIIEVRALEATIKGDRPPYNKPRVIAGWFDNGEAIISSLKQIESATGIYITINPCQPALRARANNRLKDKNVTATNDKQIVARRWLLLDVDPDREGGITGIPTNDTEHQMALDFVQDVCNTLRSEGWPEPLRLDSGNGGYALYAIDLPDQDDGLVQSVLQGLAQRFDTDQVHIDQTTYNQARIMRLPGTRNCKGDGTEDRPHRLSRVIEAPEQIQRVTREMLETIAIPVQAEKTPAVYQPSTNGHKSPTGIYEPFSLQGFIQKHGIRVKSSSPYDGGTRHILEACAWDPSHTDHSACLYEFPGGRLAASCSHNSCRGKGWREYRVIFEPDAYTKSTPLDWAPLQINQAQNGNGNTPSVNSQQPDLETIIQRLDENEYGDGMLFAQVFNGQVCYDHSEKQWYLWKKHHWKKDETGKIKQLVSGHLGSIYLKARGDIHKQIVETQAEMDRTQKENSEDEKLTKLKGRLSYLGTLMEALEKRAKALRSANRMKNVLTFAMSEHNIGITGDIWDSDPWLLGVSNGVIDLRTGQLREGYPIDYIRSVSPTKWTGLNTPCPRFEKFLQEIFEVLPEAQLQKLTNGKYNELPKEEQEHITEEHRNKLIGFLKRLLGYSMTGLVIEHIFPILYGEEGRNGKDTLFTLLKFVLGPAIANAISNDVFLNADKGRAAGSATPHLTDLQGKRLVWGSETKQGDKFNISQIKQLTGGGSISARPPYGFQYTFEPTHTLFLMTNNKPHADAKDKAFWSRACLIEFNLRFVDKPQGLKERKADPNLPKELESEASGILALLVRGCLDYQKQGLNRPEIVEVSTESYRASEDNIQQFIDNCCILGKGYHVGASELYKAYVEWCKGNQIPHMNGNLFGEDVTKRFGKTRANRGFLYKEIGLLPIDNTDPSSKGGYTQGTLDSSSNTETECSPSVYPTHTSESASEAALDPFEMPNSVPGVGTFQKLPKDKSRELVGTPFLGNRVHRVHESENEHIISLPVEPIEGTSQRVHSGYTDDTNSVPPANQARTISVDDFLAFGKARGYPEVPDFDLRSGMIAWNNFANSRRIRMADVVTRLGGVR